MLCIIGKESWISSRKLKTPILSSQIKRQSIINTLSLHARPSPSPKDPDF